MKWPTALFVPAMFMAPTTPAELPSISLHPVTPRRIIADTIYALAVDSAAYREYPFVYLLDEEVARYDADGRGTRTLHQVVQILKPTGVAPWAERSISYQPDRQKVTTNWMRVVKPSGEVVSDRPTQSQTSDVPAAITNPVYTTTRVERSSLSNVTPGTLVDISVTIETFKPAMAGDWQFGWNVTVNVPALRTNFVVDLPAAVVPNIQEKHLDFKRTEVQRGDRRLFQWAAQNVKPVKSQIFAPDSTVPFMSVGVSAPLSWKQIGRWYNDLARDRYVLTPGVILSVDSVVKSARTQADTIVALHRWIAKDIRYVSIALGIGGYQPRFPVATVGTGYGDCKDKATLFIAAAHHLGMSAFPVLLSSAGRANRDTPAIEQFNHVIAAVERRGVPGFTYVDLTTFTSPLGLVEPAYEGGFGLVVLPDGSSREVTFPKDSATAVDQLIAGVMQGDGTVDGKMVFTRHGPRDAAMHAPYSEPADSALRANVKRSAPKAFPSAVIDTVIFADVNDVAPGPFLTIAFHGGVGGKPAGAMVILSIPAAVRSSVARYQGALDEIQREGMRTLPIDAAQVMPSGPTRSELRLILPAGWTAQLPPAVHLKGAFGSYDADYTQVGQELRIVHEVRSGRGGILPASEIGAVSDWFKAISKDDAEFILLTKGP